MSLSKIFHAIDRFSEDLAEALINALGTDIH
jgi:hypothetical protein